jgi:chitin disaccharide deacetylase
LSLGGGRYVIVNADDFGMSRGVNGGILQSHRRGIVTSASLLVRWPAAAEAAQAAHDCPDLSLGLHVDLGEWSFRDGAWGSLYEVVPLHDEDAVQAEVLDQLRRFRQLTGCDPTHLDSHQHVHRDEPVRSVLVRLAARLSVPLRQVSPEIHYCGAFYGQTGQGQPMVQALSVEALEQILADLPPGVTELSCHPGENEDLDTMYCSEREEETRTLCDPGLLGYAQEQGIEFISFHDLPRVWVRSGRAAAPRQSQLQGGSIR